ncbi:MAG: magnesium/cobalt transporter CorA [Fimbriimonadaceae bacterium]|nr:magnesium/cobalt transporter CorA [Fimbriimonadaceae bacterium]
MSAEPTAIPESVVPPYVLTGLQRHDGAACRRLGAEDTLEAIRNARDEVVWAHLRVHDREAATILLTEGFGYHPVAVEDALHDHERPSLFVEDEWLFLSAPILFEQGDRWRFGEVGFFLGAGYVLSVSSHEVKALKPWFDRFERRPDRIAPTAAMLLHSLVDAVVDDYFPAMDRMQDALDRMEQKVFTNVSLGHRETLRLKRTMVDVRRHVSPLRDEINSLLRRDVTLVPPEVKPYFQDVYDHTIRILESVDLSRDMLATILDTRLNVISNRLNEVMKMLTVAATILMSVTLVSSIYGMNFVHMPELRSPWGYPLALLSMVAIALGEIWVFKRKGLL